MGKLEEVVSSFQAALKDKFSYLSGEYDVTNFDEEDAAKRYINPEHFLSSENARTAISEGRFYDATTHAYSQQAVKSMWNAATRLKSLIPIPNPFTVLGDVNFINQNLNYLDSERVPKVIDESTFQLADLTIKFYKELIEVLPSIRDSTLMKVISALPGVNIDYEGKAIKKAVNELEHRKAQYLALKDHSIYKNIKSAVDPLKKKFREEVTSFSDLESLKRGGVPIYLEVIRDKIEKIEALLNKFPEKDQLLNELKSIREETNKIQSPTILYSYTPSLNENTELEQSFLSDPHDMESIVLIHAPLKTELLESISKNETAINKADFDQDRQTLLDRVSVLKMAEKLFVDVEDQKQKIEKITLPEKLTLVTEDGKAADLNPGADENAFKENINLLSYNINTHFVPLIEKSSRTISQLTSLRQQLETYEKEVSEGRVPKAFETMLNPQRMSSHQKDILSVITKLKSDLDKDIKPYKDIESTYKTAVNNYQAILADTQTKLEMEQAKNNLERIRQLLINKHDEVKELNPAKQQIEFNRLTATLKTIEQRITSETRYFDKELTDYGELLAENQKKYRTLETQLSQQNSPPQAISDQITRLNNMLTTINNATTDSYLAEINFDQLKKDMNWTDTEIKALQTPPKVGWGQWLVDGGKSALSSVGIANPPETAKSKLVTAINSRVTMLQSYQTELNRLSTEIKSHQNEIADLQSKKKKTLDGLKEQQNKTSEELTLVNEKIASIKKNKEYILQLSQNAGDLFTKRIEDINHKISELTSVSRSDKELFKEFNNIKQEIKMSWDDLFKFKNLAEKNIIEKLSEQLTPMNSFVLRGDDFISSIVGLNILVENSLSSGTYKDEDKLSKLDEAEWFVNKKISQLLEQKDEIPKDLFNDLAIRLTYSLINVSENRIKIAEKRRGEFTKDFHEKIDNTIEEKASWFSEFFSTLASSVLGVPYKTEQQQLEEYAGRLKNALTDYHEKHNVMWKGSMKPFDKLQNVIQEGMKKFEGLKPLLSDIRDTIQKEEVNYAKEMRFLQKDFQSQMVEALEPSSAPKLR